MTDQILDSHQRNRNNSKQNFPHHPICGSKQMFTFNFRQEAFNSLKFIVQMVELRCSENFLLLSISTHFKQMCLFLCLNAKRKNNRLFPQMSLSDGRVTPMAFKMNICLVFHLEISRWKDKTFGLGCSVTRTQTDKRGSFDQIFICICWKKVKKEKHTQCDKSK